MKQNKSMASNVQMTSNTLRQKDLLRIIDEQNEHIMLDNIEQEASTIQPMDHDVPCPSLDSELKNISLLSANPTTK